MTIFGSVDPMREVFPDLAEAASENLWGKKPLAQHSFFKFSGYSVKNPKQVRIPEIESHAYRYTYRPFPKKIKLIFRATQRQAIGERDGDGLSSNPGAVQRRVGPDTRGPASYQN